MIFALAGVIAFILFHFVYLMNIPVAQWKFEGNTDDSGKYGYQTTSADTFVNGKRDQAVSITNVIVVKDNPTVRLQGPFTVSMWVKNYQLSPFAGLIGRLYGEDSGGYTLFNHDGELYFKRDSEHILITNFTDITQYHLITLTYDGQVLKGYFDGNQKMEKEINFSTQTRGGDLIIGGPLGTGKFIGSIDDFRIYDKALSPLEVYWLYLS